MTTPHSPYDASQQQPDMSFGQGGGYAPYQGQGGYDTSAPRGYLQGGPVGFAEAVTQAFRNVLNYQGRASRSAYWWFALASVIIGIILYALGLATKGSAAPIEALVNIGLFVVSLPLAVRRLHDQDKSGFWIFIVFVPIIGSIWLFVLTLLPGTPGPNRFG